MYEAQDAGANLLAGYLAVRVPFYFIKLGDAAVECLNGYKSRTCDGERYSAMLANRLMLAWTRLAGHDRLVVGDWRTASFSEPDDKSRYTAEYEKLLADLRAYETVHFESLLLMRDTPALENFYRAVRDDRRRKLLMGPVEWLPLARILGCDFMGVPMMEDLVTLADDMAVDLRSRDFDVLLYGAGMAGHVSVVGCWQTHRRRTYVNLGSALDPATARGRTRRQQLGSQAAYAMFDRLTREYAVMTAGRGDSLLKVYDVRQCDL